MRVPDWRTQLISVGLVAAVVAVYGQTSEFGFVNFDDDAHVYEEPRVVGGLTAENVRWAFGIHGPSQWHPLAWMSHQADCTLHALEAGKHHATSVALHAVATVLLFVAMRRLLGGWGVPAFVAGAFAFHPLNVESVAWISERRDVLCAVFWMLTLIAWERYARRPTAARYAVAALCHAGALMSKPLAVTLPLVLLLLDVWPLGRLRRRGEGAAAGAENEAARRSFAGLLLEKTPLLAMSVFAGVMTVLCQQAVGTVATLSRIPLSLRVANAVAGYGWYLAKVVWPSRLACFYPHPAIIDPEPWKSLLAPACFSAAVLLALTLVCVCQRRERPGLLVGWLWFLVVLAPMTGILQVGEQRQADRYGYIPLIGVFLMLGCAGQHLARRSRAARQSVVPLACVLLVAWGAAAWRQAGVWRNSVTLFSQALEATDRNHFAHNNLGLALMRGDRTIEAIEQFQAALEIAPSYELGRRNLAAASQRHGSALANAGMLRESVPWFRQGVELTPDDPRASFNLGLVLARSGHQGQALEWLERARELNPEDAPTRLALAAVLKEASHYDEARREAEFVLKTNQNEAAVYFLLGEIERDAGRAEQARRHFEKALRLRPGWPEAMREIERLR